MSGERNTIVNQLQRNTVALISIIIAVSSLSYNTWRNEKTEDNRNQRFAAFEVLLKLSELQQVVFHSHYDMDKSDKGNPRTGWSYVLTVRDLSQVMQPPLPVKADELVKVWGQNWDGLGEKQESEDLIMEAIDIIRNETVILLESLD